MTLPAAVAGATLISAPVAGFRVAPEMSTKVLPVTAVATAAVMCLPGWYSGMHSFAMIGPLTS